MKRKRNYLYRTIKSPSNVEINNKLRIKPSSMTKLACKSWKTINRH